MKGSLFYLSVNRFNLGDKRTRIKVDGKITSINVSGTWYENAIFVLPNQAKQVFYFNETTLEKNWQMVQKFQRRNLFDIQDDEDDITNVDEWSNVNNVVYQENESNGNEVSMEIEDILSLHRHDIVPDIVEKNEVQCNIEKDKRR